MSTLSTPPMSPSANTSPKPRDTASLPPLITSPSQKASTLLAPSNTHTSNIPSNDENASIPTPSRPPSVLLITPPSGLPYTLVRDFAYPYLQPPHFGIYPEPSQPPSAASTPVSDHPSYSDPRLAWDTEDSNSQDPWRTSHAYKGDCLEPVHFGDGPPWSEDEDLQSPIVVSSRHKKHKSASESFSDYGFGQDKRTSKRWHGRADSQPESDRGPYAPYGTQENSHNQSQGIETTDEGLPHAQNEERHGQHSRHDSQTSGARSPHCVLPDTQHDRYDSDSDASSPDHLNDESRYSRDYQFTIASPDEEMHGKAVALFDFERENENELPLVEGQVIWVSYRYGQGWLVAEDPKTHESGLVPEEYVRLLRDIKGGLHSLTGQVDGNYSATEHGTPVQDEHGEDHFAANDYQQPIVSTFSTSSKDLRPYPQHLLGTQAGMAPPQVVHYHGQRGGSGSQANTPTFANDDGGELLPDVPGITRQASDE